MKKPSSSRLRVFLAAVACGLAASLAEPLSAQDFSVLRINEIMTDNETSDPADSTGLRHDMVELFNSGDVELPLSGPTFAQRLALSDTETQPLLGIWTFPAGTRIPPKGFLTIFLDADPEICDLHASFALSKDGSEPLTLWGHIGTDGRSRQMIDQVWLPPLDPDVSFGRFPDGAGPAPVPQEETFDHFRFYPPGQSTFGTCEGTCANFDRTCRGAPNGPGGNISPRVSRIGHSTNRPATGEAVMITARVKDDKVPTPPSADPPGTIASVTLQFRVNLGPPEDIPMVFDQEAGVMTDPLQPLDRFTHWTALIPGQPKDAVVEFLLRVEDTEGGIGGDPDPEDLCLPGVGPCNEIGLPGPNCSLEGSGPRFVPCNVRFRYVSGYEIPPQFAGLVINEIIANQTEVLQDLTDAQFDDIVELFNGSDVEVDLSGLWMSDKAFHPEGWQFPGSSTQFPPGSRIGPRERLVIWADADGGRCPRDKVIGDGQDCPDPTDPAERDYHLDFALEREGDEVYLFDVAERGHGVIHGVEFGPQDLNSSLSLIPDGDRSGTFVKAEPTPGAVNSGAIEPLFQRGDSDGTCIVDITDAVFTLNHLFLGSPAPVCMDSADNDDSGAVDITDSILLLNHLFLGGPEPHPPGINVPGPDVNPDSLEACQAPACN